jgi:hypothetical protein
MLAMAECQATEMSSLQLTEKTPPAFPRTAVETLR